MKHVISTGLALILMLSVLCSAAAQGLPDVASLYKDRDLNDQWDADEVETIRLSESGAEVSDPQAVSVENQTVTIREEGDYLVTGTWKGQIVVSVGEEKKVLGIAPVAQRVHVTQVETVLQALRSLSSRPINWC